MDYKNLAKIARHKIAIEETHDETGLGRAVIIMSFQAIAEVFDEAARQEAQPAVTNEER